MSDEQAISAVVHLYVDGMAFANEGALRKAFHPDAAIIGNYKGALEWTTRDEASRAFGQVKDQADREGSIRLASKPLNDYLVLVALEIGLRGTLLVALGLYVLGAWTWRAARQ